MVLLKLSVVIPTLDEEDCIGQVMDELSAALSGKVEFEIIVVDGMSKDRTREIAEAKGAVVIEEPRRGYGRAYKTGFSKARGEIIATMDGDCTYPAEYILPLVEMLEEEDLEFISTDRFGHMEEGAMSAMHKIGNLALSFTTRLLFGRIIRDSQSGMWVFRREVLSKIRLESDGMPFSEEIKIEAFRKLRSKEVMIRYRRRVGEVKLSSWRDGWDNFRFLWRKRFRGPRDRSLRS
ncbi:MAG TPA: glycosyltransferase family 2 protein [Methanomassiliicoccaceae archaeon]|jgi:glycosyltransferase involved in cell wall biosynthesis|nr:glycosyltransferase family 2 protein [Methanomassiliicoccaceae archaeon]HOK28686.1 glycosyltransferase family 2 protein [Methanomassiliicoccaceae archaeon]HPT73482.1 glycosyltransferase family 2 protein [Methanomassiliicoccaceae archaeon]HQA20849.1 glycosyltransferase family 2 protein [Methanomassiliicoccaceae archaeon]HQD88171.1 glycosyltransferase family 2 protein [Methanomassiliicoccaceae archaeon]